MASVPISRDFTRLPQIQFGQYLRLLQIRARCGKEYTPDIPVTTNLMGFYPSLDYQKWAKKWILFPGTAILPLAQRQKTMRWHMI